MEFDNQMSNINTFYSGLAVEPNPSHNDNNNDSDILGTIRANAEQAQPSDSNTASTNTTRRTITMYRSGFTVDNGPFRRLDDPSNADFLRDLSRGITPRELSVGAESSGNATSHGDMEVGLIDKRQMDYEDDTSRNSGNGNGNTSSSTSTTAAFSGLGQSLGGNSTSSSSTTPSNGIITPSSTTSSSEEAPIINESKPSTTIQIRLLNRQRLIVKCNLDDTIQTLVRHIEASGHSGNEPYVLSSGYPPVVLDDLNKTIDECGLKGAQVIQKKV